MRLRSTLPATVLAGTLLAGCGATGPETPEPATEIPDDFPLAAGMAGPQDGLATSRTGTGLRDLRLCGTTPLRGLGIRDRMVADNSGGESADTRELVLLGNREEAALVHVVPVGAALLVTSTYGQWTTDTLDDGVDQTVEAARPAVAKMCVFTI